MGQKVNPKIFRINIIRTWNSKWFSKKDYRARVKQDILIRKFLENKLKDASIDDIEIKRLAQSVDIVIHAAKPGLIIGRGGQGAEDLKKNLKEKFLDKKETLNLNIQEVERPALSAKVILSGMISDIEKRIPYRRVMKQSIDRVKRAGAEGVKVQVAGRLGGTEIARTETLAAGKIPLHTLRADIDYARSAARTIYGAIGIKVWIYRGEVFNKEVNKK